MAKSAVFTLTAPVITGLFHVQRYRFLTISQFATASGLSRQRAKDVLRVLELRGVLGHFGYVSIPGQGKTPKIYCLKRRGFELLRRESGIPEELLGSFAETYLEAAWSPQMYHRLRIVDLLIALEVEVRKRPQLNLVRTWVEYRRTKKEGRIARETTDFIVDKEIPENRIIPDAAFVLENIETGKSGLFFLEMDMGTERIVTQISHDRRQTLRHKIEQYDRYLTGLRYTKTYKDYGEFRSFILLFVTTTKERINNIRSSLADLPEKLHGYYRFTTFDKASEDFFGEHWQSRSINDPQRYRITR